jgi:hypothetical protein
MSGLFGLQTLWKNPGWWLQSILKNMKVNGKDHPIYEMENRINVPNISKPVIQVQPPIVGL